jgi:periplasmic divalent cation tolerance protein
MDARSDTIYYQVTVTAPDEAEASALGQMAVHGRLAACAQVSGPITSTYRWEGQVTSTPEYVCTLKTTSHRLPALVAAVRQAHSYDVPEIVATAIAAGDGDYLAWIDDETKPAGPLG